MGLYDKFKRWVGMEITLPKTEEERSSMLRLLKVKRDTAKAQGDEDELNKLTKQIEQVKGAKIPASTSLRAEHRSWAFAA